MRNPNDFKKGISIQPNPEMTRADHLKRMEQELIALYNSLDGWEEFGPDKIPLVYEIQQKLLLYSKIHETLGELAGECERFALWCDAKKKGTFETFVRDNKKAYSTVKELENAANIAGQKYRQNRDYFMGLAKLWDRRRDSTKEAIQILKWMIRDAHVLKGGHGL